MTISFISSTSSVLVLMLVLMLVMAVLSVLPVGGVTTTGTNEADGEVWNTKDEDVAGVTVTLQSFIAVFVSVLSDI